MTLRGIPIKRFAKDFSHEMTEDNVFNGAAALAFYLMLAIFPAMIFLLSILPYLPIEELDTAIMDLLNQALPEQAAVLFTDTVQEITQQRHEGLLSFGALFTLWAASSGMYAIMQQLNITYNVKESRSFLKARGVALLLTLLFGVLVVGAFALVVFGGYLEEWLVGIVGWRQPLLIAFAVLRWVIIGAAILLAFALFYYLAPNVKDQKFKFITPGSIVGGIALILASLGFRLYVTNFADYDATYGSIGAVIVLMLWLYVTGLVILLGSEVNVVYERLDTGEEPKSGKKQRSEREAAA